MVAMCGRFPTGGWDVKGLGPGLVGCWKGLDFCGDFFEIGRLRGRAGRRGGWKGPRDVAGRRVWHT
jgi:hypothetical protein